jgi:hypothetical protein
LISTKVCCPTVMIQPCNYHLDSLDPGLRPVLDPDYVSLHLGICKYFIVEVPLKLSDAHKPFKFLT